MDVLGISMNWRPVDYIALIFSGVIGFGLIAIVIASAFLGLEITDHRARVVEIVLSAVLSIISMYVGAQIQKKRDQDD